MNADGSDARQLGGPGVLGVFQGRPALVDCSFAVEASLSDGWLPAWSRDGSQIAFAGDGGIGVARADGSGRYLRVPGPAFDPDWTPDGRLIYTKTTGDRFDPSSRIFISDGVTERQLIPDATSPARSTYRDWSAVWLR